MKKADIISRIKPQMTNERFNHTLRVARTANELAHIYDACAHKVELAALFHDYAKCWETTTLKNYIKENHLPIRLLDYHKELWHGPIAAHLIQHNFNIEDEDILNAIRYHTTGRAHMSNLELVLFVADYIEPGRHFPGVEEVREAALKDLRYSAWLVVRNTIEFLFKNKATIYPDTFYAYNDLTKKMGEM
ncbi:bis(5'-nucleosyl)-tetraphosphatase (symmetrical) YqeK [Virgibacillus sp. W0181]|uniref:bis(5'-nucleosyl)-tetraphosphatase (symmetrical) YqeK n=1 Tax=Virgibacillus sp. W0181 TaxID=3391581 RepID=UPI003F4821E9